MNKEEVAGLGIAFGAGLIIGIGVALLYAPQSGQHTREAIKNKAKDIAINVKGKLGHGSLGDVKPKGV